MPDDVSPKFQANSQQVDNNRDFAPVDDSDPPHQMSHLDFLSNPLRSEHPFGKWSYSTNDSAETWSPKEMALFNACICRFEKEFDVFTHYVSHSGSCVCSVAPD